MSFYKLTVSSVLALLTILFSGAPAQSEETSTEAAAVARTIVSAINKEVYASGPVPANLLDEVMHTCEGDRVYCLLRKGLLEDGQRMNLQVRVDMTKTYPTTQAMPIPRSWKGDAGTYDPALDAIVRYKVKKGRAEVGMVDIRSMRSGIYFRLGTSQLASRGEQASIAAAVKRASILFQAADANGLTTQDLPQVTLQTGEYEGKQLVDDDTAYVMVPPEGNIPVRFDVLGRPTTVPAGEKYTIEIELPTLTAAQRGQVRLAPTAIRTDTGFRIETTEMQAVRMTISVSRSLFDTLRDGTLDALIPIVFKAGGGQMTVHLQLATWELIITRFELAGMSDGAFQPIRDALLAKRQTRAAAHEAGSDMAKYNDFRIGIGNLVDAWNGLTTQVTPGNPIDPNAIVAGWAVNQATQSSFIRALNDAEHPHAWAFPSSDRLSPQWKLAIARPPEYTAPLPSDEEGEDEGMMSGFGNAANTLINTVDHHRRAMKQFYIHQLDVTVHPIEYDPSETKAQLRDPKYVFDKLKGKPLEPDDPNGARVRILKQLAAPGRFGPEFERERDIEQNTGQSHWAVANRPLPHFVARDLGAFEVRLKVEIGRRDNTEDRKKASVALRFMTVDMSFDVLSLEQTTRRLDVR